MPALLIETGFLNNEQDNTLYDEKQEEIARAIADAVLERWISRRSRRLTGALRKRKPPVRPFQQRIPSLLPLRPIHAAGTGKSLPTPETFYRVQTGLFRIRQNADRMLYGLLDPGAIRFSSRRGRLFQGPGRRLPPARKCHSDGTPPAPRRLFHPDYHLSV